MLCVIRIFAHKAAWKTSTHMRNKCRVLHILSWASSNFTIPKCHFRDLTNFPHPCVNTILPHNSAWQSYLEQESAGEGAAEIQNATRFSVSYFPALIPSHWHEEIHEGYITTCRPISSCEGMHSTSRCTDLSGWLHEKKLFCVYQSTNHSDQR